MVFEGSKRKKWVIYLTLWWLIYFTSFLLSLFFVIFHNFFINYFFKPLLLFRISENEILQKDVCSYRRKMKVILILYFLQIIDQVSIMYSNLKEIWKWKFFTYYDRFISVNDSLFWCDQYIFRDLFSCYPKIDKISFVNIFQPLILTTLQRIKRCSHCEQSQWNIIPILELMWMMFWWDWTLWTINSQEMKLFYGSHNPRITFFEEKKQKEESMKYHFFIVQIVLFLCHRKHTIK